MKKHQSATLSWISFFESVAAFKQQVLKKVWVGKKTARGAGGVKLQLWVKKKQRLPNATYECGKLKRS
jgi:hypothetical protein